MATSDNLPPAATLASDTPVMVLEERIRVEKRTVETGHARVHVTVSEHDETVETLLKRQDVTIERVAFGHQVDTPPGTRREGDTFIVPILEEIVVTEKRLILREELRIRINETSRTERQTVQLRREHAEVDLHGDAAEISASETTADRSTP